MPIDTKMNQGIIWFEINLIVDIIIKLFISKWYLNLLLAELKLLNIYWLNFNCFLIKDFKILLEKFLWLFLLISCD